MANTERIPWVIEPGVATAGKMKRMMRVAVSQSLAERTNRRKIDSLLDVAAAFEYLAIGWTDATLHAERLAGRRSVRQAPRSVRWSLELAARHDTCPWAFFDIWRELGQSLRELMCANYDGVPRSLRWMIETCIFWADMQLDAPSAKQAFEHYSSLRRLTRKEFERWFSEIYTVGEARLAERLIFKEKFRAPSVKETIQNLAILRNTPGYEGHILREELMNCYTKFSEYAHITLSTAKELRMGPLHGDFAFFQDYKYDKDQFNTEIGAICKTVDLLIAVMMLVETNFYGYEGAVEFFESLKHIGWDFASKLARVKEAFPFTWAIVGRVQVPKRKLKKKTAVRYGTPRDPQTN